MPRLPDEIKPVRTNLVEAQMTLERVAVATYGLVLETQSSPSMLVTIDPVDDIATNILKTGLQHTDTNDFTIQKTGDHVIPSKLLIML
jgi:hypothetical protein